MWFYGTEIRLPLRKRTWSTSLPALGFTGFIPMISINHQQSPYISIHAHIPTHHMILICQKKRDFQKTTSSQIPIKLPTTKVGVLWVHRPTAPPAPRSALGTTVRNAVRAPRLGSWQFDGSSVRWFHRRGGERSRHVFFGWIFMGKQLTSAKKICIFCGIWKLPWAPFRSF